MSSQRLSRRQRGLRVAEDEMRCEGGRVRTRRASADDLPVLARIHKMAYSPSHFTALMPDEILKRYYSYFLDGGSEIWLALGDANEGEVKNGIVGEVQGFAVFGEGIPERIALFKRECFNDILFTSLRHPWSAVRKALVALSARLSRQPSCSQAKFLLLSIAVAVPRCGIGSCLLDVMLNTASRRCCGTVGLYVNADNVSAVNAYFAAGFVVKNCRSGQFYMEHDFVET